MSNGNFSRWYQRSKVKVSKYAKHLMSWQQQSDRHRTHVQPHWQATPLSTSYQVHILANDMDTDAKIYCGISGMLLHWLGMLSNGYLVPLPW